MTMSIDHRAQRGCRCCSCHVERRFAACRHGCKLASIGSASDYGRKVCCMYCNEVKLFVELSQFWRSVSCSNERVLTLLCQARAQIVMSSSP